MFRECDGLTEMDLSSWDTSKSIHFANMFYDATNLKTIWVSDKFVMPEAILDEGKGVDMFTNCAALVGGNGTAYSDEHRDFLYAHVDAPDNPGYFTLKGAEKPVSENVYAILYENGTMAFQIGNAPKEATTVKQIYPVSMEGYALNPDSTAGNPSAVTTNVPWEDEAKNIRVVQFADVIRPLSTVALFYGCAVERFEGIENLDTSLVTDMSRMFSECAFLKELDLSHFNTSRVTNMTEMFNSCSQLRELNLSHLDTSHVLSMNHTLGRCYALESVNLSGLNTSNVVNFQGMFYNCNRLKTIDVSSFDTSKAETMWIMFSECSALQELDLSSFDTGALQNAKYMFFGNDSLKVVYASDRFQIRSDVSGSDTIFDECPLLTGGQGTRFNSNQLSWEYARIDGGPDAPGYFTRKPDAQTRYTVTAAATEHGSITPSVNEAIAGETVTLTAVPADGYALDSIRIVSSAPVETKVTAVNRAEGVYRFAMPIGNVTVSAVFVSAAPDTDTFTRFSTKTA